MQEMMANIYVLLWRILTTRKLLSVNEMFNRCFCLMFIEILIPNKIIDIFML